ncbi:MAG: sulfate reduction electron transfer complex DsrMKJOP subunit DsrM [Nitrospirae bacterium]|nr:sulfate reduction electron transfer complex DsrMKJOP subunit DsrM [Nitrospirota bacterium]MCL5237470.1 sulfate reduction electron transfer complex DsrMKJOP subunit DsrM [Nitrospirota bacterium]
MKTLIPFFAVVILIVLALAGVNMANMQFLFGVAIPYAALATFILGVIYRVVKWGRSPVPFCIPTTCGQQKSLPWIKQDKIENPSSTGWVIVRMALEVLLFRSLFRNIKTELRDGPKLAYGSDKWLWLAGLAFHWSFLIILVRHFRFFSLGVPFPIRMIEGLDSFLQIGVPLFYMTDAVILAAVTYLFIRRMTIPTVKYISLPADYFPLFLILAIAASGVIMRYFAKVDIVSVKQLTMGLVSFSPVIPKGIGSIFYVHLFLISILFAYFPFSKLVHMAGVFMSPTRNMANDSRMVRHINPWNYPVHVHTYEEYENDFRAKMKAAGLPVEKE